LIAPLSANMDVRAEKEGANPRVTPGGEWATAIGPAEK